MTPREERGILIAATKKLTQKGSVWIVPSQSGSAKYTVSPDPTCPYCSCPDHAETGERCKHLFAVEIVMKRDMGKDGSITDTRSVTFTEKKTYRTSFQPLYDYVQMNEKHRFQELLFDLCKGIKEPERTKTGRKPNPMADQIFSTVFKIFSTVSFRRFNCDLIDAHAKGYTSKAIHPQKIAAFMDGEEITPILEDLIIQSSLPLRSVETAFAPDSSGFSTSRFVRWIDEKYGSERSGKAWVKAHIMTGTKTNIVTAVIIDKPDTADCPQFKPLVEQTAKNFSVKECMADKAYLSHQNLELMHQLGGRAYIPFKVNSAPGLAGSLWEKSYNYFMFRREEFEKHYHQRSLVESTFSMVKAKFRDHVRSKTDVAMKNEVLCKFLCHNICCLMMAQHELGIEPLFWKDATAEVAPTEPVNIAMDADFRFSD
jgi:transposase